MPTAPSRVILFVDDDPDDHTLVREALETERLAFEARFVRSGEELFDYLHRRSRFAERSESPAPSLVFLDMVLFPMDGFEVLQALGASQWTRVPIIAFSSHSDPAVVARCYDLGAKSFIKKPATFEQLGEVLRTVAEYWFAVVTLPDSEVA